MVVNTCTWDLIYLYYLRIVVKNHPRDIGLWLYLLTTSVEGNMFFGGWNIGILLWGVLGGRSAHSRVIIVEAIQNKVE